MQILSNQTSRMLLKTEAEIFDALVAKDSPFRKLNEVINFKKLVKPLRECYSDLGRTGFDIEKGFKALLVQFWEDYSDRQMENAVKENIAIKWFAGFGLMEETPDYSYFCKLRKRIGTDRLTDIFNKINDILAGRGLFGNFFTFVDASSIITKTALWEERDNAIKDGQDKLNNSNVEKYATDKDARWGAKSKTNIWFGYKRTLAVDGRDRLIRKIQVAPANVPDFIAAKGIYPDKGLVLEDKGYDYNAAFEEIIAGGAYPGIIRKNNNKQKKHDLDHWISAVRMPFEGVFSKLRKRAKFRGLSKVRFQCLMEGICHNLKRAIKILPMENSTI